MKLADFSVDRPVAISMLIIALVILGLVSLPKLAVDLYPDMELPVAVVVTSYEDADPAEVEKIVTKPLEAAVGTASNITEIRSISSEGNSLIVLFFDWGTDMDEAAIEVREKIDMFRDMLPSNVGSPRVMKMDPNSAPIMLYTLSGDDLVTLNNIAEDTVKSRLERIKGVASVDIAGEKEYEYKVILDRAKLESYGITAGQVAQAVIGDNISGTGGTVEQGVNEMAVRIQGEYNTAEDLSTVQIPLGAGAGSIKLSDIAEIKKDFKDVTEYSYVDGKPALSIHIFKSSGSNTVQVAREVKKEVQELNKLLPEGVKLTNILDFSEFIEDSINNVVHHTLIGGSLALLILYLFLRNIRSTLVVAIVMPIAVITTFTMMYFADQTINLLSLGGLALGLGSLVDFSVVVLESIYRYRQEGYNVIEAAKLGTAEVGNAVFASGMSQVVVFAPIVFVQGLAGILFGPLALTVSISHIAALFAALTLVPMLSSRLLKNVPPSGTVFPEGKTINPVVLFGRFFSKLSQRYGKLLQWALAHRKTVIFLTLGLLLGSIALMPMVGTEFMPTMDTGEIALDVETPPGTSLEETREVAYEIEDVIKQEIPDYERIFTRVGTGDMAWLGVVGSNEATVQVKLPPKEQRDYTTEEAMEKLRAAGENIPGATVTVKMANQEDMGSGSPIEISIKGDDLEVLKQIGTLVTEMVKNVEGTRNVTNSLDEAQPQVLVKINREQASLYGLSASQILSAVNTAFDGQVVSRVRTGDDEIDIRLMYPDDFKETPGQLADLMITSPTGARVALESVADITIEEAPTRIIRSDQVREVTVSAEVSGRDLGSVNQEIESLLEKMAFPDGYDYEIGGQAEDMAESFGDLSLAMLLAVVLVYMVMAAQFESLFHPFIIMFSLPPTIVGVVLGLLITGHRFSVTALIGAIMLVGIVVNNAIVLVDYINTLRRRGLERNEAIMKAGPIRLRPILMTTMTTVLALLPLAFGKGEGSEGWAPLAVVVAFGLTLSTLITLVLVPVVYTIFDDLGKKIIEIAGRFRVPFTRRREV
ncbi:MAG: efflux RND transporter permease subunit [Desulfotomaculum sp.]|nr:efflux RND transporter permease subunit [Desulfotomaculum sp.]